MQKVWEGKGKVRREFPPFLPCPHMKPWLGLTHALKLGCSFTLHSTVLIDLDFNVPTPFSNDKLLVFMKAICVCLQQQVDHGD